ncbi:protein disulfide-isomerase A4 [Lycorma delicatula]|uniref:protein disulfide-isomerase A4 n=1 Tax=Lycorma delicatula TaxID=130591 RepID=UPI003F51A231
MRLKISVLLIFLIIINAYCSSPLEHVSDDELLNLFISEKYVVVLFAKKDCPDSEKYETEIINIREDLVDTLSAWVVKTIDSQLLRLYSPGKEPVIVFFRHGIPLLYDGPLNDELIIHTFTENKEPTVRELSDETFEHLTQASSGATTGDWFVMFHATNCVECKRLQATWEAVGAKLKTRMNVAMINRQTTGRVTSRRFGIIETPTFVLFRLGKMYRYNIPKYNVASFVSFASDWYKNARAVDVPVPKSPFDDLVQAIVDYLKENPWTWKIVSVFFSLTMLLVVINKLKSGEKKEKSSKKDKSEKSKEKSKKAK